MLEAFIFQCDYNGCVLSEKSVLLTLSFLLFLFVMLAVLFRSRMRTFQGLPFLLMSIGMTILLATLAFQSVDRFGVLSGKIKFLFKHTAAEDRSRFFGDVYPFSEKCRVAISGHHYARLISDVDFTQVDGIGALDRLTYYLYPLDVRPNLGQADVLIYYHKTGARSSVPPGYKVVFSADESNLVAIKEGGL